MEIEDLLERQDIPKDVIKTIQQSLDNFRQIEEKLRESEEQYRNVVERANDGIVIVQDSLIKYVNPSLIKITGYTVDDLHNAPFINYIHQDFRSEVMNRYEKRMAGLNVSSIYETVLLLKNEKTLEVEINAGLITYQGKAADLAIIRDLTQRKYADQALKESEARNRAILSAIPDLIFQVNKDGEFVAYSGARDELYTAPEEFLGKNVHEVLPKDLAEQTMHYIEATIQTQEPHLFEYRLQVRDTLHHYECRMTQCGEDEVLAIVRDVSEQKLAERALKESEEKYRILFDESPDSIAIIGLDGIIQDCNKAAARISSTTVDEMIGKSFFESEILIEEDIPKYMDFFSRFLNGNDIKPFESRSRLKEKEIRHFEVFPAF
ncbi:MAG: PAS domain S-box protein, partial [Candidatus Hodarchaeales archaeon]